MYGSIIKFPPEGGIIWHQKDLPKSCVGKPPAELLAKPEAAVQTALQLLAAPDRRDPGRPVDALRLLAVLRAHVRQHQPLHVRGLRLRRGSVRPGLLPQPRPVPRRGDRHQQQPDHDLRQVRQRGQRRPGASVKKPDIPLAWPIYVAVSDRWAYVADTVNRRVVRVKLGYAAEATCKLP